MVGEALMLSEVLEQAGIASDAKGVAAALNDSVVPRSEWKTTPVRDGDRIEIVRAVQGG